LRGPERSDHSRIAAERRAGKCTGERRGRTDQRTIAKRQSAGATESDTAGGRCRYSGADHHETDHETANEASHGGERSGVDDATAELTEVECSEVRRAGSKRVEVHRTTERGFHLDLAPSQASAAGEHDAANDEALVAKLATRGVKARVSGTSKPFRVRLDFYRTHQEAADVVAALKKRGMVGFVTTEARPREATSP
jgi:hypothetical protein